MQEQLIGRNWRELIRPRRLEVDEETSSNVYARFSCEPLERGFGTTVGNGLRRVLLSSLEGTAVTSVKIEGVVHEFSTLPGVYEDITQIILNIKRLRVEYEGEHPITLRIDKSTEGAVTGIKGIGDTIGQINEVATSIASAVIGSSLRICLGFFVTVGVSEPPSLASLNSAACWRFCGCACHAP